MISRLIFPRFFNPFLPLKNLVCWLLFCFIAFLCATDCQALVVSSDLIYIGQFNPGDTTRVKITMTNNGNEPELVDLKLNDYACNCEGTHFFDPVGTQPRSNSGWISHTPRLTLGPGEAVDYYYSINIPSDQNLEGSYWSVLLIEPNNILQTVTSSEGMQIQVKVRYAYHIVTNLGKGTPTLKILQKTFQITDGQQNLAIDVLNTGNLFLNPKLSLKLFNLQGGLEHTLTQDNERLYPNCTQRFHVNTQDVKGKKYKAFLLFDNGDGNLFGDTFDLELP